MKWTTLAAVTLLFTNLVLWIETSFSPTLLPIEFYVRTGWFLVGACVFTTLMQRKIDIKYREVHG